MNVRLGLRILRTDVYLLPDIRKQQLSDVNGGKGIRFGSNQNRRFSWWGSGAFGRRCFFFATSYRICSWMNTSAQGGNFYTTDSKGFMIVAQLFQRGGEKNHHENLSKHHLSVFYYPWLCYGTGQWRHPHQRNHP